MAFFPLFIDLKDKKVLIVGAGRVGLSRLEMLLSFEAVVTVVEQMPSPVICELARTGKIELVASDYREYRRVEGKERYAALPFFMILASTGIEAVDRLVEEDARLSKVLVNVAGDKKRSDFYFPGIARAGDITVGITANGRDHRLAKAVTREVKRLLDADFKPQKDDL